MNSFDKQIIETQLYRDYFKTTKEHNIAPGVYPKIRLSGVKTCAGQVHYQSWRGTRELCDIEIQISKSYYEKFGYQRSLATLMHEIAHLSAFEKYGTGVDHDDRFQVICIALGGSLSPNKTSEKYMDSTTDEYIDHSKWHYTCPTCGNNRKTIRRMNKGKRVEGTHLCGRCGTNLNKWTEKKLS